MSESLKAPTPRQHRRDPIEAANEAATARLAEDLAAASDQLEALGPDDNVKGTVFRIATNGKWENCDNFSPPFNTDAILDSTREEYGPGNYEFRVFAKGRIFKNFPFAIAKPRHTPAPTAAPAPPAGGLDTTALITMMMQQGQQSNQQMMQMFMAMNQSQTAMLTAILPALAGGKESTSELLKSFAVLQAKPEKAAGLLDNIETIKAIKDLFGGGDGGGVDLSDDLVGGLGKLAGPVLAALGRAGQAQPQQVVQVEPFQPSGDGVVTFLPPAGDGLVVSRADAGDPPNQAARFPALARVADDVLYAFGRRLAPDLAADLVAAALDREDVGEDDIHGLVAAFTLSADWIEDLAQDGIDLRSDRQWAGELLDALVTVYTDPGPDGADSGRGTGSAGDARQDGGPGAGGVAVHGRPKRGGVADAAP